LRARDGDFTETLARIHSVIRRETPDANGKPKRGAFTTVVSGQAAPRHEAAWETDSWVVFYFTHFGSFGDTLEDLLRIRGEMYKESNTTDSPNDHIDVVCDASSANRPKRNHEFTLRYSELHHACQKKVLRYSGRRQVARGQHHPRALRIPLCH
jgi:hypothetical protein